MSGGAQPCAGSPAPAADSKFQLGADVVVRRHGALPPIPGRIVGVEPSNTPERLFYRVLLQHDKLVCIYYQRHLMLVPTPADALAALEALRFGGGEYVDADLVEAFIVWHGAQTR